MKMDLSPLKTAQPMPDVVLHPGEKIGIEQPCRAV